MTTAGGSCAGQESSNIEPADGDDNYCFPASSSTLVRVGGCYGTNSGFDGQSYRKVWPDGDLNLHPSPLLFTSPRTGASYTTNYAQVGFETDLPRIEDPSVSPGNNCDRTTGAGCTRIPVTDDHTPANFYPYFTSGSALGGCAWSIGQNIPGFTTKDYGKNNQYGQLLNLTYLSTGTTVVNRYNNFRQVLPNSCTR